MEKILAKVKVGDTVIGRLHDTEVVKAIREKAGNGFTIWLPTDRVIDGDGKVVTAMKYLKLGRREIAFGIEDEKDPARTYYRALLTTVKFAGTLEWARKALKKVPVSVLLEG